MAYLFMFFPALAHVVVGQGWDFTPEDEELDDERQERWGAVQRLAELNKLRPGVLPSLLYESLNSGAALPAPYLMTALAEARSLI